MGYHQAGFDEIVGVDNVPQPNYPFTFIQADALAFMDAMMSGTEDIGYGLVHASPPCQHFSMATTNKEAHPDLVAKVREYLEIIGLPSVIENVMGAPLRPDLKLCGSMFDLAIRRHRLFELEGWFLWNPPTCRKSCPTGTWQVTGNAGTSEGYDGRYTYHADGTRTPLGYKYRNLAHAQELMGMPWAKRTREITEAIPPAYTKFIGEQFLAQQ